MLARRENLLVVVVNSRLGALGYLYDGPGTGNMGLWDNIVALQYISRNVEVFGGDPNKVCYCHLLLQLVAANSALVCNDQWCGKFVNITQSSRSLQYVIGMNGSI